MSGEPETRGPGPIEPLVLVAGGAELKSYTAAAQVLTLIAYVPLYGWVAQRLPRQRFLAAVILFFVGCIQLFYVGHRMGPPYLTFTTGYLFRPNFAAAAGAALMALRSVKIAENSTDYSVMDTAKQMIWLPTSREEKHEAKRAIDTFYVRAGD